MDVIQKIWIIVLLSFNACEIQATDSTLIERVSSFGILLQQGKYDEVLDEAEKLLPEAVKQRDLMAQGAIHNALGSCRMSRGERQQALREYTICADICERGNFLQVAKDNKPKNHTMFQLYIPMYMELISLNIQYGNRVEALHYARTGLRWLSVCNDRKVRAIATVQIAEPLMENKECRLVYPLLVQSFVDATDLELYDFALQLCSYLIICEDIEYKRSPDEYEWIKAGDMLLSLATVDDVKNDYTGVRDKVMSNRTTRSQDEVAEHVSNDTASVMSLHSEQEDPVLTDSQDSTLLNDVQDSVTDSIQSTSELSPPISNISNNRYQGMLLAVSFLFVLGVFTILVWLRYRRKQREKTLKMMDERYIEGQESERVRLAKELHDGVANQLLAVEMKLSTDGLTPQAMELLNESREQVRHVSHELLPPEFDNHTLDEILGQYAIQVNGLRKCSVTYTSTPQGADWSFIPKGIAKEIYRVVQEAVGNALKHSSASIISIGLHLDDKQNLMVMVSDNDTTTLSKDEGTGGIGTRTMRQRVESVGGQVEFYHHQYGNVVKLVVKK